VFQPVVHQIGGGDSFPETRRTPMTVPNTPNVVEGKGPRQRRTTPLPSHLGDGGSILCARVCVYGIYVGYIGEGSMVAGQLGVFAPEGRFPSRSWKTGGGLPWCMAETSEAGTCQVFVPRSSARVTQVVAQARDSVPDSGFGQASDRALRHGEEDGPDRGTPPV
jgi:hypothetical protein